jgi:signal transduction histidine kinase
MWRLLRLESIFLPSRLLQEFLVAAAIVIVCSMSLLAYAVSYTVRSSAILTAAEEGALVVDLFLGPLVQELATPGRISPEDGKKLDDLLKTRVGDRTRSLKIWLRDGTLAYSADKQLIGRKFPSHAIDTAFAGNATGTFDDLSGEDEHAERQMHRRLIEIYAPLHSIGTGDIIAVAQVYNDGERLAADLGSVQITSVAIVAAVTAPMMFVLFLLMRRADLTVAAHRKRLENNVIEANALAALNDRLRQQADDARLETIQSNEQLLQSIGQDLHDGPIQFLSALTLKLSDADVGNARATAQGQAYAQDPQEILTGALTDLRNIAQGLVLPQLDGLSTRETLLLAIHAHENITGTTVALEIGDLPTCSKPVRICLFRIVQEALNNAFNHAGGRGQHVVASLEGNSVCVAIRDGGSSSNLLKRAPRHQLGLGLRGLRRRVELLHGTFEVSSSADGTSVNARIPIEAHTL